MMIEMSETMITGKELAIVCFGPVTPTTGLRPAEYFQVTIDPNACSPSGEYIRFGIHKGDEIQGWQRVGAMTIVEILGDSDMPLYDGIEGYTEDPDAVLYMMKVD